MKINPEKIPAGANLDAISSVEADIPPTPSPSGVQPTADTMSFVAPPPGAPAAASASYAGRYRLDRLLGRGGYGEVWKGFDPVLDVVVAIKRPREDRINPPSQSDLFVAEARKQAGLNHPAIVKIRHAERHASSWLIVSDFIDGVNLAECMLKKRFSAADSARLVADIADALQAAHRQRLVHRDVKPANILIDESGRPFLTDFGLALAEEDQQSEKNIVAGTHAYMSPEQIRGEAHLLDGRADIYSLGVVLYELLTGERPFRGNTFQDYREQILARAPKPPRAINDSIPRELERICLKCLAKSPAERYLTGSDLASELRHSVKPRSARLLWAGIGVGVVGLAISMVLWRPWSAPDGKIEKAVEKPAAPPVLVTPSVQRDGWTPLWDRLPKKLVWPGRDGDSLLELKEREQLIVAVCEEHGLIQLGEVNEPDYTFRVDVKMLNGRGTFGVLLGQRYIVQKGNELSHFELIRLQANFPGEKERFILSHYTVAYSERRGGFPTGQAIAHALIDDLPNRACTLEITVANDRLSEIRWDGRPLPEMTRSQQGPAARPHNWKGGICCFLYSGTFYLHRPELKIKKS